MGLNHEKIGGRKSRDTLHLTSLGQASGFDIKTPSFFLMTDNLRICPYITDFVVYSVIIK